MPIILDRRVVDDDWLLLGAEAPLPPPAQGRLIVPLVTWQAQRDTLRTRIEPVGVWLDSHEDPATLADDVAYLPLIAVHFPKFADGRGYSIAHALRTRWQFKGQLRAIGDVLRDQLFYLNRVGFNAFAIRADKDIDDAVKAFQDFSETYQGSVDQPLPLFRRRNHVHAVTT